MFFGHIDEFIYEKQVTLVELAAASAMTTSMLAYQVDCWGVKGDVAENPSLWGQAVHMQNRRIATRGNITSFLNNIEGMMEELEREKGQGIAELPHQGPALADRVHLMLRGAGEKPIKIAAATARWSVIYQLIAIMHKYKKPGYAHLDLAAVEARCEARYGEDGTVPPEIIVTSNTPEVPGTEHLTRSES